MSKNKAAVATAPVASVPTVELTTKRFVIRKSLLGANTVIKFTNAKNKDIAYNHDKVYNQLKARFDAMPCFAKYGSYTNSKDLPVFVRTLENIL
jgi:hypothetical protein